MSSNALLLLQPMRTVCSNVLGAAPCCCCTWRLSLLPVRRSAPSLPVAWAQQGPAATTGSQGGRPWRALRAYRVEIETESGLVALDVGPGETILQAALDQGVELSHDCKMGVCMTCPAKLVRA